MEIKITSKHFAVVNGEVREVKDLKEAESIIRNAIKCETENSYVMRKEYHNRKLVETYMVG